MSFDEVIYEITRRFRALVGAETGAVLTDLTPVPAAERLAAAVSNEGRPGSSIVSGEAGPYGGILRSGRDPSGFSASQMRYAIQPSDPGARIEGRSEPAPLMYLALAGWFAITGIGVLRNLLRALQRLIGGDYGPMTDALVSVITGSVAFALGFLAASFIREQVRRDNELMLAFIARVLEGRVVAATSAVPAAPSSDPIPPPSRPPTRNKPIVS